MTTEPVLDETDSPSLENSTEQLNELQLLDETTNAIQSLNSKALELNSAIAIVEQKFTENIIKHKGLHCAIIVSCFIGPALLISSFILATKRNGKDV